MKGRRRGPQEALDLLIIPNLVDAGSVIELAALGARIRCYQPAVVRPGQYARQRAVGVIGLAQRSLSKLVAPIEKDRSCARIGERLERKVAEGALDA
jgi:hypothetical protein